MVGRNQEKKIRGEGGGLRGKKEKREGCRSRKEEERKEEGREVISLDQE